MGLIMNLDLTKKNLSDVNYFLQHLDKKSNERDFVIKNPLITKKTSTPTYPPLNIEKPA